jgi:phosphohistidine phosphatase SixA
MEAAVMDCHSKSLCDIETAWVHEALLWALHKTNLGRTSILVGHEPHFSLLCHLFAPEQFEKFAMDLPNAGIRRLRFGLDDEFLGIDRFDPPAPPVAAKK